MTDMGLNLWGRMLQVFGEVYGMNCYKTSTYVKPLISLAYSFPWWMYDCLQGYDLWLHPILLLFWLHWKWHYICFITLHVLGEFRSEIALVFPNWFWSPWSSIVSTCHGFYGMLLSVVLTMYSSLLYRLQIHTLNNEFENLTSILCFLHVEQSLNKSHFFSLLTIFKSSMALTLQHFQSLFSFLLKFSSFPCNRMQIPILFLHTTSWSIYHMVNPLTIYLLPMEFFQLVLQQSLPHLWKLGILKTEPCNEKCENWIVLDLCST